MTKSWRPEGWKKPYRLAVMPSLLELAGAEETNTVRFLENKSYEAGADAMLGALEQSGRLLSEEDAEERRMMRLASINSGLEYLNRMMGNNGR